MIVPSQHKGTVKIIVADGRPVAKGSVERPSDLHGAVIVVVTAASIPIGRNQRRPRW
jgi:hypothetical protein